MLCVVWKTKGGFKNISKENWAILDYFLQTEQEKKTKKYTFIIYNNNNSTLVPSHHHTYYMYIYFLTEVDIFLYNRLAAHKRIEIYTHIFSVLFFIFFIDTRKE